MAEIRKGHSKLRFRSVENFCTFYAARFLWALRFDGLKLLCCKTFLARILGSLSGVVFFSDRFHNKKIDYP